MFMFLGTFGPGALAFLIAEKCSGADKKQDWIESIISLIAYTAINLVIVISLLKPLKKIEMIVMVNGNATVRYGITAFWCAFIVAVIEGIIIGAIKKKANLQIQILSKEEA